MAKSIEIDFGGIGRYNNNKNNKSGGCFNGRCDIKYRRGEEEKEGVPDPSTAVGTTPQGDIIMQQRLANKGEQLRQQPAKYESQLNNNHHYNNCCCSQKQRKKREREPRWHGTTLSGSSNLLPSGQSTLQPNQFNPPPRTVRRKYWHCCDIGQQSSIPTCSCFTA